MSGPVRIGVAAAARCLALDQLGATVVDALTGVGVESMVIKGPGLARRLYAEDPSRRRYSDIDVLVARGDFERAEAVLAALGYDDLSARFPRDEWAWHERHWGLPGTSLGVDLHRSFAGVADPDAFWSELRRCAEPLPLSGTTVQVPDVTGCALLVALHAAAPAKSVKPLADLDAALAQLSDQVWRDAAGLARRCGCESAFVTGLGRVPIGSVVVGRLGLDGSHPATQRWTSRLDLLLLRQSVAALRGTPGVLGKLGYARRRLIPTVGFLRRSEPLARTGRLGLGLAYVARPFRLLRPARREVPRHPRRSVVVRWRWWLRYATVADVVGAGWTVWALRGVRADLAAGPLDRVRPSRAPLAAVTRPQVVGGMLRRRHASCLERSLVLQQWHASRGEVVELVVGVTAPGEGFRAHAWLASEPATAHDHDGMTELHRRVTPIGWLRP